MSKRRTICVCTPYRASAEPRAPRHARALAALYPEDEVVFFDCAPAGEKRVGSPILGELPNLKWITHEYPTRVNNFARLAINKLRTKFAQARFKHGFPLRPEFFSPAMVGVTRKLASLNADVIFPHNIEMLLPSVLATRPSTVLLFDCMEFYSDMGDGQTALFRQGVEKLEREILPTCRLLTTSSEQVSGAYVETYGPLPTLALYNCPPLKLEIQPSPDLPLRLYWRNSVLGLSQRGLGDILEALTHLPAAITLSLQGRQALDGGEALRAEIKRLGLTDRVSLLPPHGPDQAVSAAASHCVGLCLERPCNRNHELTVSNKIFDYMMAGLGVVASDLPGLRSVIDQSSGGVVFEPGSVSSLVRVVRSLHDHPSRLRELRLNARDFAIREANREVQMDRFKNHMANIL